MKAILRLRKSHRAGPHYSIKFYGMRIWGEANSLLSSLYLGAKPPLHVCFRMGSVEVCRSYLIEPLEAFPVGPAGSYIWESLPRIGGLEFIKKTGFPSSPKLLIYFLVPLCIEGVSGVVCSVEKVERGSLELRVSFEGRNFFLKIRPLEDYPPFGVLDLYLFSRGDKNRFRELIFEWLKSLEFPFVQFLREVLGEARGVSLKTRIGGYIESITIRFSEGKLVWEPGEASIVLEFPNKKPEELCSAILKYYNSSLGYAPDRKKFMLEVCEEIKESPAVSLTTEIFVNAELREIRWMGGTLDISNLINGNGVPALVLEHPQRSPLLNEAQKAIGMALDAERVEVCFFFSEPYLVFPLGDGEEIEVWCWKEEEPREIVIRDTTPERVVAPTRIRAMLEAVKHFFPKYREAVELLIETVKNLNTEGKIKIYFSPKTIKIWGDNLKKVVLNVEEH